MAKPISSISGNQTTAGSTAEDINLQSGGSTPAATFAVTAKDLQITDLSVACEDVGTPAWFYLEQSNDGGSTWFLLHASHVPGGGSYGQDFDTPILIEKGGQVQLRCRVQTDAAAEVAVSMQAIEV